MHRNLNYAQCLENRKDMVWTPKNYTLIVYSPNGKDVVL